MVKFAFEKRNVLMKNRPLEPSLPLSPCAVAGDGGHGVSQPVVAEAVKTDKPWRVVVLNDPVNLMSYVVMVLRRLFGFSVEKARRHMLEVHTRGRSVVWTGSLEQAELYVQRLQQWQLTANLERDD